MDTWLTLHRHLHWHLINTPSTSWSSLTKFLIDSYSHSSADYWPTVGQMWIVSIKYQSGCWLSAERDVDGGYQSRVSIDTQPRMLLLVNMIPLSLYSKYYSWPDTWFTISNHMSCSWTVHWLLSYNHLRQMAKEFGLCWQGRWHGNYLVFFLWVVWHETF